MRMRASIARIAACLLWLAGAVSAQESGEVTLGATTDEPRAFGYHVGDLTQRRVTVQVPEGLTFDTDSLPRPGLPGQAIELRAVDWRRASRFDTTRHELLLTYQVFVSPPEVRTFELPPIKLRFTGQPRAQELRIDAWPLTVSPLVPVDVSPRRGLGELQPDEMPPLLDVGPSRQRLLLYAALAVPLAAWLLIVYVGLPWRSRQRRPFGLAWQRLRRPPASPDVEAFRAASQALHEALNRSAGEVLFEPGLDRFVARRPAFAPARDELARFFQRSREAFFGAPPDSASAAWLDELRGLARRLRDIERGSA